MKSKLFLLALTLVLCAEAASAQQHNNRDRSQTYYDDNNGRNEDDATYGPRRVRYDRDRDCWTGMSAQAFRQALSAIRHENFDRDRLKLARQIARRNHLNTSQIRTIAQQFNFDSSKLEFAKYAYGTCIDPENYYALGRIFSFSSSKEELYDYIARV
jgi:hypothetical protein